MKLNVRYSVQPNAPAQPIGGELEMSLGTPSGRGFIALLEAFRSTGGTAPGEVIGRLLQEHTVGNDVSLAKLIYTGQVFGFEWRSNLWIPMFQFDAHDLSIKAGVQRVRSALPPLGSGWSLACWFTQANARLNGRAPVDVLDEDIEAVVLAAASCLMASETESRPRLPGVNNSVSTEFADASLW